MHDILKVYVYDSPDGQNCLIKTAKCAQVGAFWGALGGALDAALYTQAETAFQYGARIVNLTGPGAATGFMFAATSCLVGEMRGKNDPMNHCIGGFAAGTVWGLKYRSLARGMSVGLAFAVFGGLYKAVRDEGYTFTGGLDHPGKKVQGPYVGKLFLTKPSPEPSDRY